MNNKEIIRLVFIALLAALLSLAIRNIKKNYNSQNENDHTIRTSNFKITYPSDDIKIDTIFGIKGNISIAFLRFTNKVNDSIIFKTIYTRLPSNFGLELDFQNVDYVKSLIISTLDSNDRIIFHSIKDTLVDGNKSYFVKLNNTIDQSIIEYFIVTNNNILLFNIIEKKYLQESGIDKMYRRYLFLVEWL